ncbi:unnamed protein product [Durusdinium trenchii]
MRHMPLVLREQVFSTLGEVISSQPLAPLDIKTNPLMASPPQPNCHLPALKEFLTGDLREKPLMLIDLPTGMGGGPELEFLELRLLELQDIADLMVAAESDFTFRGDRKPRLFQKNANRFKNFNHLLYLDLDRCERFRAAIDKTRAEHGRSQAQSLWAIQNTQRQCLWQLLQSERPNLTNETLVIFSDLDEIPNGEQMLAMKHCEWKTEAKCFQLQQHVVTFNLRQVGTAAAGCFPQSPWKQGLLLQLGWARAHVSIPLRLKVAPLLKGGATHLSHFGSAPELLLKGLQHGEGGGLFLKFQKNRTACTATDQDIDQLLTTFRDDPISIVRSWEKKSHPLPKAKPNKATLEKCGIPWALRENPQRYVSFWGLRTKLVQSAKGLQGLQKDERVWQKELPPAEPSMVRAFGFVL